MSRWAVCVYIFTWAAVMDRGEATQGRRIDRAEVGTCVSSWKTNYLPPTYFICLHDGDGFVRKNTLSDSPLDTIICKLRVKDMATLPLIVTECPKDYFQPSQEGKRVIRKLRDEIPFCNDTSTHNFLAMQRKKNDKSRCRDFYRSYYLHHEVNTVEAFCEQHRTGNNPDDTWTICKKELFSDNMLNQAESDQGDTVPESVNDPCLGEPCMNFGTCIASDDFLNFLCSCTPGFSAETNCEDCLENRFGVDCSGECGFCQRLPCETDNGNCPDGECSIPWQIPPRCSSTNFTALRINTDNVFSTDMTLIGNYDDDLDEPSSKRRRTLSEIVADYGEESAIDAAGLFGQAVDSSDFTIEEDEVLFRLGEVVDSLAKRSITNGRARRGAKRQAANRNRSNGVQVTFFTKISRDILLGPDFEEDMVQSSRKRVGQFNGGGEYTIDVNSIKVATVYRVKTSKRDSVTASSTSTPTVPTVIVVSVLISLFILSLLGMVILVNTMRNRPPHQHQRAITSSVRREGFDTRGRPDRLSYKASAI